MKFFSTTTDERRPLYTSVLFSEFSVRVIRTKANSDGTIQLVNDVDVAIADAGSVDAALAHALDASEPGGKRRRWPRPTAVTVLGADVSLIRRVRMTSLSGVRQKKAAGYLAAEHKAFNAWKLDDCSVKSKADPDHPSEFVVSKTLLAPLNARVRQLRTAGLSPRVDHIANAIARALPDAAAAVEIGDRESTLCVYNRHEGDSTERDDAALVRTIDFGVQNFVRAIMRTLGLDEDAARAHLVTHGVADIMHVVDDFAVALKAEIFELEDRERAYIPRLELLGPGARIAGIAPALATQLQLEADVATLPQLVSDVFPADVLSARAPELVVAIGAALSAVDERPLRRINLAGGDSDSVVTSLVNIDTRRLRRAALAPIIAALVVGSAQVYESVRIGDAVGREDVAQHSAIVAKAKAQDVHALEGNVEQLLAVQNELTAIRQSASLRAAELDDIGRKMPDGVRVESITATSEGWTIEGSAKSHAEIGAEIDALRSAFPGITAVIPKTSARQSGDPTSLVKYTVTLRRTTIAPGQMQAHLPSPPFVPPFLGFIATLGAQSLRRRIPWDRRMLVIGCLCIGGAGYFYVVAQGEASVAQHESVIAQYETDVRNAHEAVRYQDPLAKARERLTASIQNLTPLADETSLVAAAYKNFDSIADANAAWKGSGPNRLREGVSLQRLEPSGSAIITAGQRDQKRFRQAFNEGRVGADGSVRPAAPAATAPDQRAPIDPHGFATGGASDAYATIIPISVVFEGPISNVLTALAQISDGNVLTNIRSASLRTIKADRVNPRMGLTLEAAVYLPIKIDASGKLVPTVSPKAVGTAAPANPAPDASATTSPAAPAVTPEAAGATP